MDFGTHHQALGGFGPYRTRCESPGAPNTKFRDPIAPAHRGGAARELGAHRGLAIAERERLGAHHAYAIAGARNRNTEPHSQAEEAHNSLSAREAGIAVAGRPSCRAGTEVWRHAFCTWRPFGARVYAATTLSSRQCDDDCPHLTGDCGEDIPGEPTAVSGCFGRGITTHHREYNRKRSIKPTEKASAAIITDASPHGWVVVFIPDSGGVKIAGGNGRGRLFLSCRPRCAWDALPCRPFPPSRHPPWTFRWTTLCCRERRIKAAQNQTP
ncbi:hypothetical protein TCDM_10287 [Trypanosoma cruzi Dm28c]|uniref:Uncharacterized protein n=1 Tax=Trypanosoma cruzi Dm28c TaxID=1416333 RepID=V5BCG6_TRYCR|nr:hypothetical protein TCDM_10287 [Trypanosoma cruzi Dm28c]